jgi:alpha-1,6-mannosyltransferase
VEHPLWYFYSALPRALLGALPLAIVGAALEPRVRPLVTVAAVFVTMYSKLPHKEVHCCARLGFLRLSWF